MFFAPIGSSCRKPSRRYRPIHTASRQNVRWTCFNSRDCSECRDCGLRPQHLASQVNGGCGPFMTWRSRLCTDLVSGWSHGPHSLKALQTPAFSVVRLCPHVKSKLFAKMILVSRLICSGLKGAKRYQSDAVRNLANGGLLSDRTISRFRYT